MNKVSPRKVAKMVEFYGSLEAARAAFVEARAKITDSSQCLWVSPKTGRIEIVWASEVQYDRSPDAPWVLPYAKSDWRPRFDVPGGCSDATRNS